MNLEQLKLTLYNRIRECNQNIERSNKIIEQVAQTRLEDESAKIKYQAQQSAKTFASGELLAYEDILGCIGED